MLQFVTEGFPNEYERSAAGKVGFEPGEGDACDAYGLQFIGK